MTPSGITLGWHPFALLRWRMGFEARVVARKLTRWQRRNAALKAAATRKRNTP